LQRSAIHFSLGLRYSFAMQDPNDAPISSESSVESAREETAPSPSAVSQSLSAYFIQAFRSAFLLSPNDSRLQIATPSFVLLVCLLTVVIEFAAAYAMVAPNARFYPEAVNAGWLSFVALLLACWITLYRRDAASQATLNHVGSLFALVTLTGAIVYAITSIIYIPLYRADAFSDEYWGVLLQWILWGSGAVWSLAAVIVLLARKAKRANFFVAAVALLITSSAIHFWAQPAVFWYPQTPRSKNRSGIHRTCARNDYSSKPERSTQRSPRCLRSSLAKWTRMSSPIRLMRVKMCS
jgi:hypothetical protein